MARPSNKTSKAASLEAALWEAANQRVHSYHSRDRVEFHSLDRIIVAGGISREARHRIKEGDHSASHEQVPGSIQNAEPPGARAFLLR